MPDITMCRDEECVKRATCYRFVAKPSEYWQSWFTESPRNKETDVCGYYWEFIT